jgi:hypothetical protein
MSKLSLTAEMIFLLFSNRPDPVKLFWIIWSEITKVKQTMLNPNSNFLTGSLPKLPTSEKACFVCDELALAGRDTLKYILNNTPAIRAKIEVRLEAKNSKVKESGITAIYNLEDFNNVNSDKNVIAIPS